MQPMIQKTADTNTAGNSIMQYESLFCRRYDEIYVASPRCRSSDFFEYLGFLSLDHLLSKEAQTNNGTLNLTLIKHRAQYQPNLTILCLFEIIDPHELSLLEFETEYPPNIYIFCIAEPSVKQIEIETKHQNFYIQYVPANLTTQEYKAKKGAHLSKVLHKQIQYNSRSSFSLPRKQKLSLTELGNLPAVPSTFSIETKHGQSKFDFFYSPPPSGSSRSFVILHQAAIAPYSQLPIFHRWKWSSEINAHTITVNDPTLYLDPSIGCGWWLGKDRDGELSYLEEFSEVVTTLLRKLNIPNKNLYLYGASAGGFAALRMAPIFPGSTAIVDIAQINLITYNQKEAVKAALRASNLFGDKIHSKDNIIFPDTLDLRRLYSRLKVRPRILYLQNENDPHHVEKQMIPFMNAIDYFSESIDIPSTLFATYSVRHPNGRGHIPLGRYKTVKVLNEYIAGGPEQALRIMKQLNIHPILSRLDA